MYNSAPTLIALALATVSLVGAAPVVTEDDLYRAIVRRSERNDENLEPTERDAHMKCGSLIQIWRDDNNMQCTDKVQSELDKCLEVRQLLTVKYPTVDRIIASCEKRAAKSPPVPKSASSTGEPAASQGAKTAIGASASSEPEKKAEASAPQPEKTSAPPAKTEPVKVEKTAEASAALPDKSAAPAPESKADEKKHDKAHPQPSASSAPASHAGSAPPAASSSTASGSKTSSSASGTSSEDASRRPTSPGAAASSAAPELTSAAARTSWFGASGLATAACLVLLAVV